MTYFTALFTVSTYEAFLASDRSISGFRATQRSMAEKVHPGDSFVCYITGLKRWFAILEVTSECFEDHTPIFTEADDPFVIRVRVRPRLCLPLNESIPI